MKGKKICIFINNIEMCNCFTLYHITKIKNFNNIWKIKKRYPWRMSENS